MLSRYCLAFISSIYMFSFLPTLFNCLGMLTIFSSVSTLFTQGGDIEKATDWIFSRPGASSTVDMDATPSSTHNVVDSELPDGGGS